MPPDFACQQRAPLNTLSGYSAQGQNAPGPVILQDYTHRLAPGQARFPAHPDNVPPSMTHHHQIPVNPSGIMPRVEIKGYTSSSRGGVAAHDHAPSRSVLGFAKNSPAHLRRPSLEEDGVEDEMYSHEDAPLLVSDYLLAPSSRQPGQHGAAKPSRWSRAAAARGEQGEAVASSAAVAYVESHGVKKERSSSAASPVSSVPGDMLRHHHEQQQQHDNDERNSLRRNARGLSSNGGSIDHGVDFADSKTPPSATTTTLWQRNPYGQFSPTTPGEGEEAGALSVAYRHCHRKRMSSLTDRLALRQLISVVVLCILFMVGETVGGVLSNSLALFTDVLHLGSDLISFIISLLAMWLSNKPASKKMSFGYHRAEVIGALLSVFIIWLVSGILCYIAIERIIKGHYIDVRADEMLITASLGVVFNFIMGFVLHSEVCCGKAHSHKKFGHGHSHGGHGHSHGGHGHSHGGHGHMHGGHGHSHDVGHNHSHSEYSHKDLLDVPSQDDTILTGGESFDYQQLHQESEFETSGHQMTSVISDSDAIVARDEEELLHKHKNINVRAAFIHVVGDIIQSIGVLVAALIIKFTDDDKFKLADPICTFLFSVLVLVTTITILRDALLVVMEGVPRDLSFDVLKRDLKALDGVVAVHSLHIWALTLDRNALAVHLAIENHEIHNQVLTAATKLLQDRYFFFHTTIQVEIYHPAVMSECHECLELN